MPSRLLSPLHSLFQVFRASRPVGSASSSLTARAVVLLTVLGGTAGAALAAPPASAPDLTARYEKASQYLPWTIKRHVRGMSVSPDWSEDGKRVSVVLDTATGKRELSIDLASGARSEAAAPTAAAGEGAPAHPEDLDVSPNGKWAIRVVDGNLHRIAMATGQATPLTTDAEPDYVYALVPHSDLRSLSKKLAGDPPIPYGLWSPDGERYLTYRVDERHLYKLPFVISTDPGAKHQRPWVHYQNTAYPDDEVQRAELMVFDMRNGRRTNLEIPKPVMAFVPTPEGGLRWNRDGSKVFAAPETPDYKSITVYEADPVTGKARAVLTETTELTYRPDVDEALRFHLVGDGSEIVFYSERSDWGHYYLYDTATGRLKNAITAGDWAIHSLVRIDAQGRWLYFLAGGREAGRDPYYSHLYRVSLDGGEPQLLTPENAQHSVQFSPDGQSFVDTYSTVDTPPTHVLRGNDGRQIAELGKADISGLKALGWTPPQRFSTKAADGVTDLYGTLFLPYDFDPGKSYPIVESQYTGTQSLYAPRRFLEDKASALGLAQLGFVVMMFDGRPTPFRRQSMQDLGFGKAVAAPIMLEDHIAAMQQLAKRHRWIDIERTGIYGHSWGGYRAARALLQFPDFYKAGVATAGSHDNYLFVYGHNRWYGHPKDYPDSYDNQTNMDLAGNLKGKLLLAHGEIDDDVHIALTMQLADALIRENKDFDLLVLPRRDHKNLWQDGYMIRKAWDYFVQHLRHETPPTGVRVPDYDGPAYRRPMHPE